jgi:Cdc6-like AAA superfamily ATPase
VLFSSVIDELESTSADSEVIYFYCKNGDPQRSSFNTIARSLILQILQKDATCLDYLFETIIASGEHQPKSSDVLHQLLENLITCRNSVIIAVDGLDECDEPERSLIFSFIEAVSTYDSLGRNVKFFLTSRKENDICSALESARCLHIKQQHVEDDIQAYIKFQATRLSQKFDFDKAREDIIVKDISTRPKGM